MVGPRWLKRFDQLRRENPVWQVWVDDEWLCPYCASVAVRGKDGPAANDAIIRHLERHCPHFKSLEEPTLPMPELRTRAREIDLGKLVRAALRKDPSWQLLDVDRQWFCPFCGRGSGVEVPEGNRIGRRCVSKIRKHLTSCFGFDRGRGTPKSLEQMKKLVREANRLRRMTEQIRLRMERDESWRRRDGENNWICLYCKKTVGHISISSRLVLLEQAPAQIAAHLLNACPGFDSRKTMAAASSDPVAPLPRETVSPRDSGPGRDSSAGRDSAALDWRDSLKLDLESVRAHVAEASASRSGWGSSPGDSNGKHSTVLPTIPSFELALFFKTVKGMAGDFYELLELPEGRYGLLFGDVAGDGADTGLAVEMTRSLVQIHLGGADASPAKLLQLVNRDLCSDLDSKHFASVFFGVLDPRAKTYSYARAGYPPPLLVNPRRPSSLKVLDGEGLVLGVDTGEVFDGCIEERTLSLLSGDLLVHASPGVLNLHGPNGQVLGSDGFRRLATRYGRHEAEYLKFKLEQLFEEFHDEDSLSDDAIVLAVRVP